MTEAKPFFKCLGGKTKILGAIMDRIPRPDEWDTYVEPFVGGGAVFFELFNRGWLNGKRVVLGDADTALIEVLRTIQRHPKPLHESLIALKRGYDSADPDLRKGLYADTRSQWNHGVRTAAANLFLKGLSFNGIWRMSKQGHMNAPWGKYESFHVPDYEAFVAAQAALQRVTLVAGDWRQTFAQLGDYDRMLTYIDPPYDGGFVAYTENHFTTQDQADLIIQCSTLHEAGGNVVYSNANTDTIRGMIHEYWPLATVRHVLGKRSVAASAAARGDARELIVTGYQHEQS